MRILLTITFIALLSLLSTPVEDLADAPVVQESASLETPSVESDNEVDFRVIALKKYLDKRGSPLSSYAEVFVAEADKYNLDWRLVPAISGVESSFGKRIPYKSYNAYGWANGEYKFKSWEESISIVNKTLREKYVNKGAGSIAKIARIYAPPSQTWGAKVKIIMKQIDPYGLQYDL